MTKKELGSKNYTAEKWLTTPGMGNLNKDLTEQEKNFYPGCSVAEIWSALYAKGSQPRENLLIKGEYKHLITLIQERYPQLFQEWINIVFEELENWQHLAETGSQYRQTHKIRHYKELQPYFTKHPKYDELKKYLEFY